MEYRKDSAGWLLRFEDGECVRPVLEGFLAKVNCTSGWIGGVGGICDPELSYFNREENTHTPKVRSGFYEVVSLTGYVALSEKGVPGFHMHGSFSDEHFRVFGGRVFNFTVGPTLVLYICWIAQTMRQKIDPATGVPLLDPRLR